MLVKNGIYEYNRPEEDELKKKFSSVSKLDAIRRREEYLKGKDEPDYVIPEMGTFKADKGKKQDALKKKLVSMNDSATKTTKSDFLLTGNSSYLPDWLKKGSSAIDLSWKKVEDLNTVQSGEKVYLAKESHGLPPGNYEISKERDYNTLTNEDKDIWSAKDKQGKVTQFRVEEKENTSSWWDNPLNPLSWFN